MLKMTVAGIESAIYNVHTLDLIQIQYKDGTITNGRFDTMHSNGFTVRTNEGKKFISFNDELASIIPTVN